VPGPPRHLRVRAQRPGTKHALSGVVVDVPRGGDPVRLDSILDPSFKCTHDVPAGIRRLRRSKLTEAIRPRATAAMPHSRRHVQLHEIAVIPVPAGILQNVLGEEDDVLWVDERIYQPIENTAREIKNAIGSRARGYVALIGGPGTGKSTTLTQTLRYKTGLRVVKYYAYVRDDPSLGRGEAYEVM